MTVNQKYGMIEDLKRKAAALKAKGKRKEADEALAEADSLHAQIMADSFRPPADETPPVPVDPEARLPVKPIKTDTNAPQEQSNEAVSKVLGTE